MIPGYATGTAAVCSAARSETRSAAPVEFLGRQDILRRFGPDGIRDYAPAYGRLGAITDDTQMTLFCAEGLLRAHVRCQLKGIGPVFASVTSHAYLRWLFTQGTRHKLLTEPESGWLIRQRDLFSRRAPGNTCLAALRAKRRFGEPAANDSKGCGGAVAGCRWAPPRRPPALRLRPRGCAPFQGKRDAL